MPIVTEARVRSIAAGLFACLLLAACGPIFMIPGGALSGTVTPAPDDWSFTEAIENFQLETRPSDPHSVTIWGVAMNEHFYVGTSPDTAWGQYVADDPRVRLRAGDELYELRAEPGDPAERDAVWAAIQRKYDYALEAEQKESGIFFRLVAR